MSNGGIGILSSITGAPVRYAGGGGGGVAATIAWTTTSPLQNTSINDAYSITLVAAVNAGAVNYSIISGDLPSGLTLNTSTGVISGTATQESTSTFTVRATITSTTVSVDRIFSITVVTPLYTFTNATFTPGGQTGRLGPSLTQARTGLGGPNTGDWKNNTEFFNTLGGVQLWTVPASGTYRIEAWGAQGGYNFSYGEQPGLGARMRGDFVLVQGEVIRILAGQAGVNITTTCAGASGGGGTFVVRTPFNTNGSILVIAGGGGGVGTTSGVRNGIGGVIDQSGTNSTGNNVAGGSGGNGGAQPPGSPCSISYVSGSGGGFFTNGGGPNGGVGSGDTGGGFAFVNGGNGGDRNRGVDGTAIRDGGFGGGGIGNYGAGAGGGYSGGGGGQGTSCACDAWRGGGGGGSFNAGTNQSNESGIQFGNGQVTITRL